MLIIRTGMPYYNLIIDALSKKVPNQQIFNVGTDLFSVKDNLKYAPIFGAYYLVIAKYDKSQAFWKMIREIEQCDYVKLLLMVYTKDQLKTSILKADNMKLTVAVYDSYKASKRDRNMYIVQKLYEYNSDVKVSNANLDLIRTRLYGYSIEVNSFLQQLARSPINRKSILKIIPKKSIISNSSFGWLAYSGDVSLKELDTFILEHKYYPYGASDSLKKYTDNLISLFPYYLSGRFTECNYEKFIKENNKIINNVYTARTYLEIYSRVSIEKLYRISSMLEDVSFNNRTKSILIIYKVIRLIRGVV